MKYNDLKPCPFCGGEAILVPHSTCSGEVACIGDCGCSTRTFWDDPMTGPAKDRKKWSDIATEKWNRRTDNAAG